MKMPADYITKEMLREELAKLEGKMDGKFVRYKDEILNRIDDVMGQLQAIREDNLIGHIIQENFERKLIITN